MPAIIGAPTWSIMKRWFEGDLDEARRVRKVRHAMLGSRQRTEMSKAFLAASAEARQLGDRRMGTEHRTRARLADPTSATALALEVTLGRPCAALLSLNHAALAALGIDAVDPRPVAAPESRIRLTPAAREVFSGLRDSRVGKPLQAQHVVLGPLDRHRPERAAALLDAPGIDRSQARVQLVSA